MVRSIATLLVLLCTPPVMTETVEIQDRGAIDLAPFDCTDTPRSTLVQRVCYDEAQRHLLVSAGGTYSEYCHMPATTFEAFVVAPSMGQFFRQRIASTATPFACDAAD